MNNGLAAALGGALVHRKKKSLNSRPAKGIVLVRVAQKMPFLQKTKIFRARLRQLKAPLRGSINISPRKTQGTLGGGVFHRCFPF